MRYLINFVEALKDSPNFRKSLHYAELDINNYETLLEKIVVQNQAFQNISRQYLRAYDAYISTLADFSNQLFSDDGEIQNTINYAVDSLKLFNHNFEIFSDSLNRITFKYAKTFVQNDLKSLHDIKKSFDKLSDELDLALVKNAQTHKSKIIESDECFKVLQAHQSYFSYAVLDYAFHINKFSYSKRQTTIDMILAIVKSHQALFQNGSTVFQIANPDATTDIDTNGIGTLTKTGYSDILTKNHQKIVNFLEKSSKMAHEECDNAIKDMEERHTLVKENSLHYDTQKTMHLFGNTTSKATTDENHPNTPFEGYLFKRSTGKFKSWNRRWFRITNNQLIYCKRFNHDENDGDLSSKYTSMCNLNNAPDLYNNKITSKSDALSISMHESFLSEYVEPGGEESLAYNYKVMEPDLRLCTVKPVNEGIDRRFCFEIISPSKSHILQADSQVLCQLWITHLQSSISDAYTSASRKSASLKSNSGNMVRPDAHFGGAKGGAGGDYPPKHHWLDVNNYSILPILITNTSINISNSHQNGVNQGLSLQSSPNLGNHIGRLSSSLRRKMGVTMHIGSGGGSSHHLKHAETIPNVTNKDHGYLVKPNILKHKSTKTSKSKEKTRFAINASSEDHYGSKMDRYNNDQQSKITVDRLYPTLTKIENPLNDSSHHHNFSSQSESDESLISDNKIGSLKNDVKPDNLTAITYMIKAETGETLMQPNSVFDILKITGNNQCTDCRSHNPEWASINIGVTLCIECSGIHRSLGVHKSKVRALFLDSWESEHLQIIQELGNNVINTILLNKLQSNSLNSTNMMEKEQNSHFYYNFPIDPGSTREERESHIKNKYITKLWLSDHNVASEKIDNFIAHGQILTTPNPCKNLSSSLTKINNLSEVTDSNQAMSVKSIVKYYETSSTPSNNNQTLNNQEVPQNDNKSNNLIDLLTKLKANSQWSALETSSLCNMICGLMSFIPITEHSNKNIAKNPHCIHNNWKLIALALYQGYNPHQPFLNNCIKNDSYNSKNYKSALESQNIVTFGVVHSFQDSFGPLIVSTLLQFYYEHENNEIFQYLFSKLDSILDTLGGDSLAKTSELLPGCNNLGWHFVYQLTPLHICSLIGNQTLMEYFLLNTTSQQNCQETLYGFSPLHLATINGHTNIVCQLIKRGADVQLKNFQGLDCLTLAISMQNADIVTLLRVGKLRLDADDPVTDDMTFTEVINDFAHR